MRRSAPPTTATATRPSPDGGGGGGFGGGFHDPMDIFSQVFGGAFGGGFEEFFGGGARRRGSGKQRGSDLRYDLEITLEEAARGVEKELEIERYVPCDTCGRSGTKGSGGGSRPARPAAAAASSPARPASSSSNRPARNAAARARRFPTPAPDCNGEGRVQRDSRIKLRIPAGVDTGTRLRSSGNGDAGVRGGAAGDLYVFLHVRDHDVFERDDADLFCEVPLPFSVAALGGELKVPTLDGQSSIKIPAGTQGGTVFRLREKGMPSTSPTAAAGRSPRPRPGGSPDQAQRRAAGKTPRVLRIDRRPQLADAGGFPPEGEAVSSIFNAGPWRGFFSVRTHGARSRC